VTTDACEELGTGAWDSEVDGRRFFWPDQGRVMVSSARGLFSLALYFFLF
jgi:hypothetical protein